MRHHRKQYHNKFSPPICVYRFTPLQPEGKSAATASFQPPTVYSGLRCQIGNPTHIKIAFLANGPYFFSAMACPEQDPTQVRHKGCDTTVAYDHPAPCETGVISSQAASVRLCPTVFPQALR